MDIVTPEARSRMMSGIRGKDTKPEVSIRKALFALGFRYKLNDKTLPGKPDLVLPKYRAVIFVNGCFWHKHDCHLFKWPKTRTGFWEKKLTSNTCRDLKVKRALNQENWRVLTVWECALKGCKKQEFTSVIKSIRDWLKRGTPSTEITGV